MFTIIYVLKISLVDAINMMLKITFIFEYILKLNFLHLQCHVILQKTFSYADLMFKAFYTLH